MEQTDRGTDEALLLSRARGGDEDAFATVVAVHAPRLLRLAIGILHDEGAAEDAVQEALLQAWRGLSGFRGDAAMSTWLHTITIRACYRQRRAHRPAESLERLGDVERSWADPDYTVDPVEVLARAGQREDLRAGLALLPETYRVALLLHDVEGLSASKVAVATGVPLGTAKARIRRARMALVTGLSSPRPDHPEVGGC
jgi:RNA polymerase sigma-70 factor (ECF subfamily)